MVSFPPGEPQTDCSLCDAPLEGYSTERTSIYANVVCQACDARAVTSTSDEPAVGRKYLQRESDEPIDSAVVADVGDNPVFIDGKKCWRRYKFGGWITRLDEHDCTSVREFRRMNRDDV
ncbi:hypothetical protein [Natrinema altunense]|uniref:Uncharacterized protein n=1 Tax=Natrinema altunense TaxID=222984 RepID=A0A482Y0H9_9EURY|nr:hypothetical protein [Natrinema altunense]RZH67823.1 hypothetical protein ELS17_09820 [Natrinema altunense]